MFFRRLSPLAAAFRLPALVLSVGLGCGPVSSIFLSSMLHAADEVNEQAVAAYADAANFQTNGALPLAIDAWRKFLKEYPDEPLAAKASHFLGVCYMQQPEPDYVAAATAFERATKDVRSDVREESLVNLGWCQFAAAGEGESRDPKRLEASLDAFGTLIREKPTSRYLDRALFYSGEAAYSLGKAEQAIEFYDRLLAIESAQESPLRWEAVYSRGLALEDVGRLDDATAAYRQVLEGCQDAPLLVDAKIRMGDTSIQQKRFDDAIDWFQKVATVDGPERPYALLRQAFALVQANRPAEASEIYERLLKDFPDSPHAASAKLASAQAAYRAGDLAEASKRFERVLSSNDLASSTEAAHWLATIALRANDPAGAVAVARKQLDAGTAGPYAVTLRLDLAEATLLLPDQTKDAMKLFVEIYREHPAAPEAPRALYNAAFAALQLDEAESASEWGDEFLEKFPKDALVPDVRHVIGEAAILRGDADKAAEQYLKLVADPASQAKPQWPLWVIRAATAQSVAGQPDEAIRLIEQHRSEFEPAQQAEAMFIVGSIHLSEQRAPDAVAALEQSLAADSNWAHADETILQLGQAHSLAGDEEQAAEAWQRLVRDFAKSPWSDQGRYRLALMTARQGDHMAAADRFGELLESGLEPALKPYALYGRGWNLMRGEQPADAIEPLEQLLEQHPDHALNSDTKLALGMCLRSLDRLDDARGRFEEFLVAVPTGISRGHALYELALIDQSQQLPEQATGRLEELIRSVPDYPELEKVLAELAWALKDSGQEGPAETRFQELVEKFPASSQAAEAHYFVGQRRYAREAWPEAVGSFAAAAAAPEATAELREKAFYRQGWSLYKAEDFQQASQVFEQLAEQFPDGTFFADALLMIGEGHFKRADFEAALAAYEVARKRIVEQDEREAGFEKVSDRQVRELVYLHGGQSLAQLQRWEPAIEWFDELAERFPNSGYLTKAKYETANSLQQSGKAAEAVPIYQEVAEKERNELGARARFMIGEIRFADRDFAAAIPEFQRVMYGYGADQAPDAIKNWQAKSGFEAGRCAELMMQGVRGGEPRRKSAEIALQFYDYVVRKHPRHELASKSKERLEALRLMGFKLANPTGPTPTKSGS